MPALPSNIDAEELKLRLLNDRKFYIENLITIADKDRDPVPFKFNNIQNIIYNELWLAKVDSAQILKARQMGSTSLLMALFLVDCITKPNTVSLVIAHEEYITSRLLAKAKAFEASIPEELKPKMTRSSSYELSWESINSTFYIGSANSFVFGRGERVDNALCSEVAFWRDPTRILDSLVEATRNGRMFWESTPNGELNIYCENWRKIKREYSLGLTLQKPLFLPWYLFEEYKMSVDHPKALPIDRVSPLKYSDEEQELVAKYDLSEDQIRWRRKIKSDTALFAQEYPEDDESCFLQVADSYFDINLLGMKQMDCFEPADKDQFEEALVWEKPVAGETYVIGGDPSVGIHDPAAVVVWKMRGLKLVARLNKLLPPDEFARRLKKIGFHYNTAMLVVENNNPGVAVLGYLQDYPNIYYNRDVDTSVMGGRPGWTTSTKTKSYMFQEMRRLLSDVNIPDIELLRQLRSFRLVGLKIESTGPDDIAMAAMIGLAARDAAPTESAFVGTTGWTW